MSCLQDWSGYINHRSQTQPRFCRYLYNVTWVQHTADSAHTLTLQSHDCPYFSELSVTSMPTTCKRIKPQKHKRKLSFYIVGKLDIYQGLKKRQRLRKHCHVHLRLSIFQICNFWNLAASNKPVVRTESAETWLHLAKALFPRCPADSRGRRCTMGWMQVCRTCNFKTFPNMQQVSTMNVIVPNYQEIAPFHQLGSLIHCALVVPGSDVWWHRKRLERSPAGRVCKWGQWASRVLSCQSTASNRICFHCCDTAWAISVQGLTL